MLAHTNHTPIQNQNQSQDDRELLDALPGSAVDDQCTPGDMLAVVFFCTFMLLCTYLLLQVGA